MKICPKCKQKKQIDDFANHKKTKDGKRSHCRKCDSEISASWKKRNKEKIAIKGAIYQKINAKKVAEKSARWRSNNPEKFSELILNCRKVRKEATPAWADFKEIKKIYEMSRVVSKETGVLHHVDHIVPLKSKIVCGLHVHANLRIIQAKENITKSNKYWPDMP